MKLAAPGVSATSLRSEALEHPATSSTACAASRLQPQPSRQAGSLLPAENESPLFGIAGWSELGNSAAAILRTVILDAVIPSLLDAHGFPRVGSKHRGPIPRASELAELLIASDQSAALDLIRELRGQDGDVEQALAPLLEPAARSLGDLWRRRLQRIRCNPGLCACKPPHASASRFTSPHPARRAAQRC